jgi:hypothetical protein
VEDETGRAFKVVAQQPMDVRLLRKGMRCDAIVASESPSFDSFCAVSDVYVPACNLWVGDYPYLQRREFMLLLQAANPLIKAQIRDHIKEIEDEDYTDESDRKALQ